jgi:glycosyltransferase involved in cell wall biosynthesis
VTGLGSVPRKAATTALERALRRRDLLAAAAADRIACNSYYSAECIRRAYGRHATVCYLGVDTATFTTDVAAAPVDDRTRPVALAVGALDPVKGHDLVVRALGLISDDERPALHLVFERYDPDYRREVEELAHERGVELTFHQGISDDALASLYRASSVTVLAAQLEPFGLVPLESLACGTPVVAVREAGYRETIDHGVNGYLADRSAGDIADGVRRVLRGELRAAPEALRAGVVSRWNWDAALKRQLELLSATAEGGRR